MRRIIGTETEYASVWLGEGEPPSKREIFASLAGAILEDLAPGIPVCKSHFLSNGGRLYFDDESHPSSHGLIEWATPECESPLQATLYDLVGERLLSEAIPKAEIRLGGGLGILKNNTDGRGHTYGCHENYSVLRFNDLFTSDRSFFQYLVRCLTPFLVTRQILCGAGQVGPYRHSGKETIGYQLSQRADFMTSVISEDARHYRPIINTRDEPHADGRKYRRLHILGGDSNMSAWCTFIKLGATNLVLGLIEELAVDAEFVLPDPILAVRSISYNGCHTKVAVRRNGRDERWSAVEIQRRYLDMVQQHFLSSAPNSETSLIIREWEEALHCLGSFPDALGDRLDWIIKWLLLNEESSLSRTGWENPALGEINLRYHDIDPRTGLFAELMADGAVYYGKLTSSLDSSATDRAAATPPQNTRARVRGEYVAHCWRKGITPRVDWSWAALDDKEVALDDPFVFFSETISSTLATPSESLAALRRRLVDSESVDVRMSAISGIVELMLGDEEKRAALAEGLNDPEWSVRVRAVHALAHLGPASVIFLSKAAEDAHVAVRQAALNRINLLEGLHYA